MPCPESGAASSLPRLLLVAAWLLAAAAMQDLNCPEVCSCFFRDNRLHADCSGRELTDLPPGISLNVQVLDLSNNLFDFYPEELQNLPQIKDLSFAGNQLSVPLPRYFENWGRLEVLNLSHNKYESWDSYGLGNHLQKLDLSLNFINRLRATAFKGMNSLQLLNLSENRLSEFPEGVFNETYNLDTLILSRNPLEHFPSFETSSLKVLDLSMCQIATIEKDSFAGKSSLLEIDLSKNLIEVIPDFLYSATLQVLDLSYNDIMTINTNTFRTLPHLAVLDLSGNEFEEIWTPGYFSENKYLREVYLSGIRWGCEGFHVDLLLMYEFLTIEPPRVRAADTLICYTPANVTGWSWRRAYVATWHLDETSAHNFAYAAVLAGLVVGALLTACLCRATMRRKLRDLESAGPRRRPPPPAQNLGDSARAVPAATASAAGSASVRVPLHPADDSPPTYDEALLMPRLDGSFHSLPEYVDAAMRPRSPPAERLSRSINNLLEPATQADARRSNRPATRRSPAAHDP